MTHVGNHTSSLPRDEDAESDLSNDTSTRVSTTERLFAMPRLLKRKSTRRRSVYAAHHVNLTIEFDVYTYRLVWLLMFVLRLWCVLFLVWTAQLYWFVAHPYMGYYASLIGPTAVANFKPMGVCFGVVAALQLLQVYKMLYWSCYYNRLVMGPPPRSLGPDGDSLCFHDWPSRFRSLQVLHTTLKRDFSRLFFDRHGPFGVESSLFFVRFLFNELLEIASQTTQVYNSSVLVAKAWLNNAFVTITVLNCWSTPFVHFFFRKRDDPHSVALERFLVLAIDFVLDATTAMVIPLVMFLPYFEKFDFAVYNFETVYLYDDIWFANMVMENQQLLAQTKWDFLWKMVPHMSILGSLNSIRALVRPPRSPGSLRVHCAAPVASTQLGPSAHEEYYRSEGTSSQVESSIPEDELASDLPGDVVSSYKPFVRSTFPPIPEGKLFRHPSSHVIRRDLTFLGDAAKPSAQQKEPSHAQGPRLRRVQSVIKGILFLWGLALLVLHIRAGWIAQSMSVSSCVTSTRPWFATKASCSVIRYNCYANNVTSVTDAALETVETSAVGAFVFSHCSDLRVPSVISRFHNLLGIDMYNCTLVEWNVDAAITALHHPRLTYIIFVRTNMTRLPDGVLQTLPDTMADFEITYSNLSHLPDDLHERWHPMSLFYIEHAQLTEFPPTLLHLKVDDLSLIDNPIDKLPEFLPNISFYSLSMSRTPLKELPQSIGDLSNLGFLNLAFTQLTAFPSWMDQVLNTATKIFVHNTPFCANKSDEEIALSFGADAVLSCVEDGDLYINGKYPVDVVAPNRPLMAAYVATTHTDHPTTRNSGDI